MLRPLDCIQLGPDPTPRLRASVDVLCYQTDADLDPTEIMLFFLEPL